MTLQLVGEPRDDRGGHRVVALPGARPAQLRQVRERGLPVGDREAGEAVLLEAEIDRARRRELDRRRDPRRPGRGRRIAQRRPECRQLRARLQVRLAIGPAQVAERLERPAVPDRGQDVGQLAVLGAGVVGVVGDDDRESGGLGQRRRLADEPVVVGEEMVRQLDEEAARGRPIAAPEQRRVVLGDRAGPGTVARPQPADQLAVTAARQGDQPLGVLGEECLAEARHPLRAGHVGVRDEPAQAPPADRRTCQQDEMRAADPLPDPAQVLLDRGTVARQSGAVGSRSGGPALGRVGWRGLAGNPGRSGGVSRGGAPAARPARRDDDPGRVGDGRIEQLDLETDDRVEPGGLGRADETDRPIEAVVVRDGQPGQPQFDGPLDEVVRCRGAVEEREVGVAMEFGVRGRCHGWVPVSGGRDRNDRTHVRLLEESARRRRRRQENEQDPRLSGDPVRGRCQGPTRRTRTVPPTRSGVTASSSRCMTAP